MFNNLVEDHTYKCRKRIETPDEPMRWCPIAAVGFSGCSNTEYTRAVVPAVNEDPWQNCMNEIMFLYSVYISDKRSAEEL
jgi:hypothetical protein